jgi:hypothetical protein
MHVQNLRTSPQHVQYMITSGSTAPQAGGFVDSHYPDLHTLQCTNTHTHAVQTAPIGTY